jgi:hypothetical protein
VLNIIPPNLENSAKFKTTVLLSRCITYYNTQTCGSSSIAQNEEGPNKKLKFKFLRRRHLYIIDVHICHMILIKTTNLFLIYSNNKFPSSRVMLMKFSLITSSVNDFMYTLPMHDKLSDFCGLVICLYTRDIYTYQLNQS